MHNTMIMYDMVCMDFYVRRIGMFMSLNGTKHVYTVMTGLNLRIFMVSCLDVYVCLYFPKVVVCLYMSIAEIYDIQTCMI
jgi:hypothetical protein